MKPYYQQPWGDYNRATKSIFASRDGNDGNALEALACELGKAYEKRSQSRLAAKKYDDFREFAHHDLHLNLDRPDLIYVQTGISEMRAFKPPPNATYDAIIGEYPALIESRKCYLSFDAKCLSKRHSKDVEAMKALVANGEQQTQ